MPFRNHDEIAVANGPLPDWICESHTKKVLILDQEVDADLFDKVDGRYGTDLTDSDLEKIGRDPLLIAYALAASDRVIVTKEVEACRRRARTARFPMSATTSGSNG